MSVSMIGPKFYAWGRDGLPLAFGKLYTYKARTNAPKDTFQSEDGVVANTNPVILNGEGYANVYLDGSYKVVLKDANENEIWSADPVTAQGGEEWVDCQSATYITSLSFKVGGNVTDKYESGRKIRIDNNVSEYAFSEIKSSSFANSETTVIIKDAVVTTGIVGVCRSIVGLQSTYNSSNVASIAGLAFSSVANMVLGQTVGGSVIEAKVGEILTVAAPKAAASYYVDNPGTNLFGDVVLSSLNVARLIQETGVMIATQFGSKADGVSNDLVIIDQLNVAGNTVDLAGYSYLYSGVFIQVAEFINGSIISDNGTYDYTDNTIFSPRTITVGAAGTFKRLDSALDYLKTQVLNNSVTLAILDNFASESASDPMALDNYMFDHPQSMNVSLVGPLLNGGVPKNSDMTGVKATDKALVLSRYNASIYLPGAGIGGSYGFACPNGLGAIRRIAVISDTRYSIDIGFSGGQFNSRNAQGCIFEEYAGFGGVWGVIGKKANLIFNSDAFFGYQFSGGPIDSIGCTIRADTGDFDCYTIPGVQPVDGPQYAIFSEEGSRLYLPFSSTKRFRAEGSFLHGWFATDKSVITGSFPEFTGVTQPMTATRASEIYADAPVISNANPTNTAAVPGATQGGYGNNAYQGVLFSAGIDSSVSLVGGTVDNCIASYCGTSAGGKLINGYTALSINDCQFTTGAFAYDLSGKSLLSVNITNPKGGSIDTAFASAQSNIRVSTNTGITFSPAVDVIANGNLFSTTG